MTPGEAQRAGDELVAAAAALRAAAALLDLSLLQDAASRLYYAAFHAARAALLVRGVGAKTHSGQVSRFVETFGPAPALGRLLQLRTRADYGIGELGLTDDSLRALAAEAAAFVERCRRLIDEEADRGPHEPDPPSDL